MKVPRRWTRRLVLILAVVGTIGCDQVTKRIATTTLVDSPSRSYLGDTVRVVYAENEGGFLSLGADLPPAIRTAVFTFATGAMLLALAVVAMRGHWRRWPALGLALFVAGGASNWIDRIAHGKVVDFLNVGVGVVRTGVFNFADVAIMAGVVALACDGFTRPTSGESARSDGRAVPDD